MGTIVYEDFSSYPTSPAWAEGTTTGIWYVDFTGGGQVIPVDVAADRVLQLESVSGLADPVGTETAASLVTSTVTTTGDVTITARMRTVAQLRTGYSPSNTPNAWEVAWLCWNYTEPTPGVERRFYYIALKTNGFELGKVDQSIALTGGQRFLFTDSTPFVVGTWYDVEIQQVGARIQVWVDSVLRADFTDGTGSGGTPAWGTSGEIVMTRGALGLYHEDAQVQFSSVTAFQNGTEVLAGADTSLAAVIEVAWGADLTAASSSWTWTDITEDVLVDGGEQITYSLGGQDESTTTQPAQCTLRLDNRTGAYSLGPQASNWPYVKRNTPLRLRTTGDVSAAPFTGFVDSWQPDWDTSGEYAVVNVTASGILRRLQQGRAPVLSSIRRAMRALIGDNLIEYWPMEDGRDATYFSSDIAGRSPLYIAGVTDGVGPLPKFADSAPFACSDRIPNLNYAWLYAPIGPYTSTGELQMRALVEFPANGMNDNIKIFNFEMDLSTTTVAAWGLRYGVGGTLKLTAAASGGGSLGDSGWIAFDVDGDRRRVSVSLVQNGANIDYQISTYKPGATTGGYYSGTFNTLTLGTVSEVEIMPGLTAGEPIMGHLTLQNEATDIFTDRQELAAYAGEGAIDRISRLCTENGIHATIVTFGGDGPPMGPQSVADVLSLLRECELVDQGVLYDGLDNAGLTYVTRNVIVNHGTPSLSLDASAGRVRQIAPVDDDQAIRNRVTASRTGGGTITGEDADGPLGTAAVGVYDDSVTVNVESDLSLPDYLGWFLRQGTVEGYRYPQVDVDLRDLSSGLINAVFAKYVMRRIDITNLSSVRTQMPAGTGTLSLVPAGWTAALDKHTWSYSYNMAPFDPWKVIELDDSVFGLRAAPTTSTLNTTATAGATSLSVAVSAGPLWTTDSGNFPMTVEVGDLPVTVSAISGASSPQTFTVTATTLTRTAGVAVTLLRSARTGFDLEDA